MSTRTDWIQHAACAGMDPRAFYANSIHAREQVNAARRVCAACPVRTQCADWAIESGEKWGVWGGMSQQQLRQRRRRFTNNTRTSTRAAA